MTVTSLDDQGTGSSLSKISDHGRTGFSGVGMWEWGEDLRRYLWIISGWNGWNVQVRA